MNAFCCLSLLRVDRYKRVKGTMHCNTILSIVCCIGTVAGNYRQTYFELVHGTKVVNVAAYYEDISILECGRNCICSSECKLAGYNTDARLCQISSDNVTVTDADWVTIKFTDFCGSHLTLENGHVEISSDGKIATFSCDNGYTLVGTGNLHCIQGSWNGTVPSCTVDCGDPPLPTNGDYFSYSGTVLNDLASLVCLPGFGPTVNTVMCQTGGQWENTSCAEDCGVPSLPTNGDYFSYSGTILNDLATLVCLPGFGPTVNIVKCQTDGEWENTSCAEDCGTTLETDYTNVGATYPHGSLAGSTVTVVCAPGYQSDSGLVSWTFTCDAADSQWKTAQAPDCIWELMFRGTAENGYNVTDAFLFGYVNDGVTDEEGCMDVYNTTCTLNYRNPKVDSWASLNIAEVSYELYNDTNVLSVKFDGYGSTINSWFSTSSVIDYPWSISILGYTYWDLNGPTDIMYGRSFRMTKGYQLGGVLCNDHYYTVVFFPPVWSCSYDDFTNYPQFTYSTLPGGSLYSTEPISTAKALGIWVKYY